MSNFKLALENYINESENSCNAAGYLRYVEMPGGYTVAILGFYFRGLAEARVDFATYNQEGEELPSNTQSNVFSAKDVLKIISECKELSKELIGEHNPERIAYVGAESKRFGLYTRMARRLGEGFRVWTEERSLTVWLELRSGWE